MLILTRYNNQRIVVIAPDKSELWVTADDGLLIIVGHPKETHCITPNNESIAEFICAVCGWSTKGKMQMGTEHYEPEYVQSRIL